MIYSFVFDLKLGVGVRVVDFAADFPLAVIFVENKEIREAIAAPINKLNLCCGSRA
jgi:hypothetical protein